ncbi:hypothetical protein GR925_15950 [Streptomyces sp. HUCO-GS316]|uniref:hypothetical protein n=1 Tax=Streptomyces sp. HUCO-GS316 TaxID=2692198 RepID=UPI00136FA61F|nr:hypothetical protein [Streptomyces sp. HUCO-GS316]MXM64899.1 hypothetical protein [Streptomyces sp. HUCO-GS316]
MSMPTATALAALRATGLSPLTLTESAAADTDWASSTERAYGPHSSYASCAP